MKSLEPLTSCPSIPSEFFNHPQYKGKRYWEFEEYLSYYLDYYTNFHQIEWFDGQNGQRIMNCVEKIGSQQWNRSFSY